MKKFKSLIALIMFFAGSLSLITSCKNEASRYGKTNIADMVLIYNGAIHRPLEWNKDQFLPYVVHQDQQGKKNWLFDGFLFIEFVDGKGHYFAHGKATDTLARRPEWEWLMECQLKKDKGLSGLDQCISEQIREMGNPPFRHKVVVVMPVPEKGQTDWGNLDHQMDFSKDEDRIEACKWYVDRFLELYQEQGYKNFDLEGFYWVCEKDGAYRDILVPIGDYIRSKSLRLFWIPYWTAVGFDNWKTDKFDFAYIQPNYFFKDEVNYERLNAVCAFAKGTGMGLEMEFDYRALAGSPENKRGRLISYIEAFEENGVFKEASVAYYEGGGAIYEFYRSTNPQDKEIMDRLAKIIIQRKKMKLPKEQNTNSQKYDCTKRI